MSFRVLVIPEDPTYNGYILKPLIERMMAEVGRPRARVMVLSNPKIGGYDQAVAAMRGDMAERYGFWDLWLFLPDSDRAAGLNNLETEMQAKRIPFYACAAIPEIEAWLLAGHRANLALPWSEVRAHHRLREDVFEPFLSAHGNAASAGGGRSELMGETLQNYRGLLAVCPELRELDARISQHLARQGCVG